MAKNTILKLKSNNNTHFHQKGCFCQQKLKNSLIPFGFPQVSVRRCAEARANLLWFDRPTQIMH